MGSLLRSSKFLATLVTVNVIVFALAFEQSEAAETWRYRQICECVWRNPDTGECGDYDDAGCEPEAPETCGALCYP